MASAVQRVFPGAPLRRVDVPPIRNKAIGLFGDVFSFLQDLLKANIPGLVALGYDVVAKNQLFSKNSATLACAVGTAAAYVLSPLFEKKEGKVLAPFQGYPQLKSAADLKKLTENVAAFRKCTNVHDHFAVLFPPFVTNLPPNWQNLVQVTEEKSPYNDFVEEARTMGQAPSLAHYGVKLDKNKEYSVHTLLEEMIAISPLFKRAWELANRDQKLILEEHPDEVFHREGFTFQQRGRFAQYNFVTHQIRMSKGASSDFKIMSLVFEIINALQRKSFQKQYALTEQGRVPREQYALLTEFTESNSRHLQRTILLGVPIPREPFLTTWKEQNTPNRPGSISHTENYRRSWDISLGLNFLNQNRLWLQQRLQELQ